MSRYLIIIFSLSLGFGSCNRTEPKPINEDILDVKIQLIQTSTKMVKVDGGNYQPFYGTNDSLVFVKSFMIDEHQVTNADFLEFVKKNPQWRRSQAKGIFVDSSYLKNWVADTILPKNANPNAPVCNISWFAAKAYATSVQKRLPTLDEWEYLAMADEEVPNARKKKAYSDNIVDLYLVRDRQFNSVKKSSPNYWGVYNVFDLVWEWTEDFNSVLVTGDSRSGKFDDKNLVCAAGATNATDVLNYAAFMRFGIRTSLKANYTVANLGFRCAKDL
ncbi:MAG TPA: formylglycine-generating enzyme family protein [Chitinophagales bacterium]|jgi:sulfatase modifying factor 1|nr:formylglycine-generating enzyme family protein [Chitinophagales bacterium]HQV77332.1 formylglycine-generating enzyme family protein [Chitinophagales bacterium]HQW78393.1 formylglycine-generating enzyme family protein [Chitinophagales bacterium]HRB66836.1 formylglycine-generating enzyme family protein [Chitinophagales bacterium]